MDFERYVRIRGGQHNLRLCFHRLSFHDRAHQYLITEKREIHPSLGMGCVSISQVLMLL